MAITIKKSKGPINKRVLALDISTATGVVVFVGAELIHSSEITLPPLKKDSAPSARIIRAHSLFRKVVQLLQTHRPGLVVIEGYGYANAFTLATLVELGTAARFACLTEDYPVVEVAPASLKKFVSGKGNVKKENILLDVYKRWKFSAPTNNVADAYVLGRIGLAILGIDKTRAVDLPLTTKLKTQLR